MHPNKHLETNVLHLSCPCAVFSFKLGKHLCLCGTLPEALSYDGTTSHITTAHKCRVISEDQAISVIPCCRYLLSPRAHLTAFNSIQILKLTSVSQMHNCNNTNLKKWHTWPKAITQRMLTFRCLNANRELFLLRLRLLDKTKENRTAD